MELLINHQLPQQLTRENLRQIYLRTFSTKDGKLILEDLANISGMYRTNFVKDSSDYSSFLEGHRALFLYICSQIEDNLNNNMEGNL